MADDRLKALEDATEQGRIGEKPSGLDNSIYTLSGQGPETAKKEREAINAARIVDASSSSEGDSARQQTTTAKPASK